MGPSTDSTSSHVWRDAEDSKRNATFGESGQSRCSLRKTIKSLEVYDSVEKSHPGEFEILVDLTDGAPIGDVSWLRTKLNDAVKEEFGARKSVSLIHKESFIASAGESEMEKELVESSLATAKQIYPSQTLENKS